MVIVVNTSVIKNNGIKITSLQSLFNVAADTKLGNGNIIKFFSEMAKGAKSAASSVDSSAGTIKKALAGISGGVKGAWNSIRLFGKIGIGITAVATAYGIKAKLEQNPLARKVPTPVGVGTQTGGTAQI